MLLGYDIDGGGESGESDRKGIESISAQESILEFYLILYEKFSTFSCIRENKPSENKQELCSQTDLYGIYRWAINSLDNRRQGTDFCEGVFIREC